MQISLYVCSANSLCTNYTHSCTYFPFPLFFLINNNLSSCDFFQFFVHNILFSSADAFVNNSTWLEFSDAKKAEQNKNWMNWICEKKKNYLDNNWLVSERLRKKIKKCWRKRIRKKEKRIKDDILLKNCEGCLIFVQINKAWKGPLKKHFQLQR